MVNNFFILRRNGFLITHKVWKFIVIYGNLYNVHVPTIKTDDWQVRAARSQQMEAPLSNGDEWV